MECGSLNARSSQPSLDGNSLNRPSNTTSQQGGLEVGKTWQAQSRLAPENSVKASWTLGGWDNLGTEPFGATIWMLPKAYSLGLCIFTRFFSFFATLFSRYPLVEVVKLTVVVKPILLTNLHQTFF